MYENYYDVGLWKEAQEKKTCSFAFAVFEALADPFWPIRASARALVLKK